MKEAPFKDGDKVTVVDSYDSLGISRVCAAAKSTLLKITLDDGSTWSARSLRPWGSKNPYGYPRIRHHDEGDEAALERKKLLRECRAIVATDGVWPKLTTDELQTMLGILKDAKGRGQ